jgi:hypothetical protein
VEKFGANAFDRALLFDEYDTLHTVLDYVRKSLNYTQLKIVRTTDELTPVEQKAGEIAVPGEPGIHFQNV